MSPPSTAADSRRWGLPSGSFVLLVVLALVAPACAPKEPPDIEREISQIRTLSLPADAEGYTSGSIEHGPSSVAAEWEFRTVMAWEDYLIWLAERLPEGFELAPTDSEPARFVRTLPADVQEVEVGRVPAGHGLRLRIRFGSRAF